MIEPWLCRGCGHMHQFRTDPHIRERRAVRVTVTDYDDDPPPPPLKGSGVVVTQYLAHSCARHADVDVAAAVLRLHRQRVWTTQLPAFYPSKSRAEVAA